MSNHLEQAAMTLREHSCFRDLARDVKDFAKNRRFVEIVNSGNWGDALIHAGQARFLEDAGLQPIRMSIFRLRSMRRYKLVLLSTILARRAIVTGHGAYTDWYERSREIADVARHFSRTLLMPSSFPIVPPLDPGKTVFWRRDQLESAETLPEARFCHDMAFYLRPEPRKPKRGVGVLFRSDVESADFELPSCNRDISAEGTHSSSHEGFLDAVGEYEVIFTNRLHVGIAGALLGREVHLFDSRTRKIRSVYESSLKPYYERVHYHSEPPAADFWKQLNVGARSQRT